MLYLCILKKSQIFAALFPASVLLFSDVYRRKILLDIMEISRKLETERRVF